MEQMEIDENVYSKLHVDLQDTCIRNSSVNLEKVLSQTPISCKIAEDSYLTLRTAQRIGKTKNTKTRKRLNRKEKLDLGLLPNKCPKKGWDYEWAKNLNSLWRQYMKSYLDRKLPHNDNYAKFRDLLAKADYQGAELTVTHSKCQSLIGISGICVMESKNTFGIVSKKNKMQIVPKQGSVFEIQYGSLKFIIYGKYFTTRPAERNSKKIRANMVPVL